LILRDGLTSSSTVTRKGKEGTTHATSSARFSVLGLTGHTATAIRYDWTGGRPRRARQRLRCVPDGEKRASLLHVPWHNSDATSGTVDRCPRSSVALGDGRAPGPIEASLGPTPRATERRGRLSTALELEAAGG
jgi:hypothetical protein